MGANVLLCEFLATATLLIVLPTAIFARATSTTVHDSDGCVIKRATPKLPLSFPSHFSFVGVSLLPLLRFTQAIELRDGVYYPMGGFARVGEALGKVCRDSGVEFRFDCPVAEVSGRRHPRPKTVGWLLSYHPV